MQVPGYFPEPGPNSPRLLPALNVPVPLSWRDEPDEHEVQENRLREQYQSFISNELNSNARKQGLKQFVTSYRTAIVKCLLDSAYMGGNALYKLNKNGDLARAWRWTSALDEHLALYKVDGTFSCQNFLIPLYAAYRRDMTKWTLLLDTSVADSNEAGIYMLQPPLKYSKTPLPHLADLDTLDCIENSPSSVPLFLGMSQNFRDCFSNSLREPVNARMAAKFKGQSQ
ncbi:uncharacterized protein L201_004605 [Kwoniella dendrophila CBS 6074]|uniref:Uncharacterized protein n=1 Tax=Kwoniella dendrophila CBS 6074 TaxID=1295534 RepID=A0AAX4JW61_9TREE